MFKLDAFNLRGTKPPVNKVIPDVWYLCELVENQGKWGVRNRLSGDFFLPCSYDNAFFYGWNAVVLCLSGKWGAIGLDANTDNRGFQWIAKTEWDTVEALNCDLVFSKCGKYLFYNNDAYYGDAICKTWEFQDLHAYGLEDRFLFGETDEQYLLIDRFSVNSDTDKIIWQDLKDDPCYWLDSPCLDYIDMYENLPMFFDVTYCRFLVAKGGKLIWQQEQPDCLPCDWLDNWCAAQ